MASLPLQIDRLLRLNGIQLDDRKRDLLGTFVDLLLDWNRRINLVSRRDSDNIWEGHILHSLSPLFMLEIPRNISLLDLGSGGGLPGIPLSIIRDDLNITLLDSIQKKTRALEDILSRLALTRVNVVCARAEDAGKEKNFARSYDAVIARAVAPLADLVPWSRPFLRKGPSRVVRELHGLRREFALPSLLAMKGGDLQREIRDVQVKGACSTITEINIAFPGSENLALTDKKLVVIEYPQG